MSEQEWGLSIGYDGRYGLIAIRMARGEEDVRFHVPFAQFMEHIKVDMNELKALMDPRAIGVKGEADIEPARRRMLEQTDWKGKGVLDVGGYDGFAAKIALDGDAKRAICLDTQQYEHYGWDDKRLEGVEYVEGDVFEHKGQYDVIINYNVLYHVKNPWLFLEKCRELVAPGGEMLLCTLFRYHDGAWAYLYEPRECNPEDESVFWGLSLEAIDRLLKGTGWEGEQYALSHDRVLFRCKPVEPQYRQARW